MDQFFIYYNLNYDIYTYISKIILFDNRIEIDCMTI